MSDFEMKNLKTRTILLKKNYFKVSPKSTTYIFHNIFLHKTMYIYSLQYLRHLDNSNRHRSNNTSFTHFRKDFDFWFRCNVPHFSLDKPNTCRN